MVGTLEYLSMMRLRKIWAEGSFSVLKREHCISKNRKRGILAATEECLLAAMALNLKRMVNAVYFYLQFQCSAGKPVDFGGIFAFVNRPLISVLFEAPDPIAQKGSSYRGTSILLDHSNRFLNFSIAQLNDIAHTGSIPHLPGALRHSFDRGGIHISELKQILIVRKGTQNFVSISTMPSKEVLAMLHSAIDLFAKQSGISFKKAVSDLEDLYAFAERTGQV